MSATVSIAVLLKFASVAEEAASDNWCARPARIVVDSEWWVSIPSTPPPPLPPSRLLCTGMPKWSHETPLIRIRCYIAVFYGRVHRAAPDILTKWILSIFFKINEKSRRCSVYTERLFCEWCDATAMQLFAKFRPEIYRIKLDPCAKMDKLCAWFQLSVY